MGLEGSSRGISSAVRAEGINAIENESHRTVLLSEHRAAAWRIDANADFECPLSPIHITGGASGNAGLSRLEPLFLGLTAS